MKRDPYRWPSFTDYLAPPSFRRCRRCGVSNEVEPLHHEAGLCRPCNGVAEGWPEWLVP